MRAKPLSRGRWTAFVLALLLLALGGCALLVSLVDPFEIYHRATAFIPPIASGTQSYSNAGLARSWAYDSIIIGSSMTENFVPSQLDGLLGGRFIKLCINGGSPYNHRQMMELAFETHEVRTVLYGIDADALTYFYTQPKTEMPDYLYSLSPLDDVRYWFNSSVLLHYVPACLRTWGQSDPDLRDTMYAWGDLYPYGAEYALREARFDGRTYPQRETPEPYVMSQQTMLNVTHNLLPFIEAHPGTQFIFFFPPYSLARWHRFYREGALETHLSQADAVCAALLPYENVRVYDFRARTDWILDLSNYIDDYHYGPWINAQIAEDIAADRCRVTRAEQSREAGEVLRGLVGQLVSAGRWPDAFDLPEGAAGSAEAGPDAR